MMTWQAVIAVIVVAGFLGYCAGRLHERSYWKVEPFLDGSFEAFVAALRRLGEGNTWRA